MHFWQEYHSIDVLFFLVQYISKQMIYIIHMSGDASFDYLVKIAFGKLPHLFY